LSVPTAKLKIEGLASAHDEKHLETSVRALTGVYGAVASCRDHCMEVDFEDDEVMLEEIVNAASAAGYAATPASGRPRSRRQLNPTVPSRDVRRLTRPAPEALR